LAAPSFSHFQNFATHNASIAHIKGVWGWQSYKITISGSQLFSSSYPVLFFYFVSPVSIGSLPSSSCPVTRRDRPCCRFGSGIGKMYQKAGKSACCPDLKQSHFPGIQGKISGSKSVQVKGGVA